MSALAWAPHVFSMELRKHLSYRADFWIQMLANIGAEMMLAYFLWGAVFLARGAETVGGYTFKALMLYFLLFAVFERMLRGQDTHGNISKEIYEGTLTRYLVYPLSFYSYKYVERLSFIAISLVQSLAMLALFLAVFGMPEGVSLTVAGAAMGLVAVLLGGYLYFAMNSLLKLMAFWNDQVWSLLVMLRFMLGFLGGGMIPLAMFPESAQTVLSWLPFHLMVAFPIQVIFGRVGFEEWLRGIALLIVWSGALTWLFDRVWRKGSYQYQGVGI